MPKFFYVLVSQSYRSPNLDPVISTAQVYPKRIYRCCAYRVMASAGNSAVGVTIVFGQGAYSLLEWYVRGLGSFTRGVEHDT